MNILVIGGNRFFGKKLVHLLLKDGHKVAVLNRGQLQDDFGGKVERFQCDRKSFAKMKTLLSSRRWDLVYDQVCYEATEAREAVGLFTNRTNHYIFTSSQSVYDLGYMLGEEVFNPRKYKFSKVANSKTDYAEAKRQCEAVFFQEGTIPTAAVRFPIVIGDDDYTKRFEFHVRRIEHGEPIYFSNLKSRISYISSDDAARVLFHLGKQKAVGPVNACAKEPIALHRMVEEIEKTVGKKMVAAPKPDDDSRSPYNVENDWAMDTRKLVSLGVQPKPILEWLPQVITRIR